MSWYGWGRETSNNKKRIIKEIMSTKSTIKYPFANIKQVIRGNKTVFFSYLTPIIVCEENNGVKKVKINKQKYSQTTSKHCTKIFKFIGVERDKAESVKEEEIIEEVRDILGWV